MGEEVYRRLMNQEKNEKIDGDDIMRLIKAQCLWQFGCIDKQDDKSVQKKIKNGSIKKSWSKEDWRWAGRTKSVTIWKLWQRWVKWENKRE